jgi:DNA-binding GntR family transcriptional regulator
METLIFQPDLVEQVHARLLAAICSGELAPGERLTQEDLAAQFDISRQPVLQALRLLKSEGFVVDAPKRGVLVTPLDATMIDRVYQVRAVLDGLAAREAALRIKAGAPALALVLIDEGRRAAAHGTVDAMIEADITFHRALYEASGNPLIGDSAARHWAHIRRAMGGVLMEHEARASIWDEHAAILHAINQGDAAQAEKQARSHGAMAGKTLVQRLRTAEASAKVATQPAPEESERQPRRRLAR